jgi:transcriptional regulator with XRE-family HTH domain
MRRHNLKPPATHLHPVIRALFFEAERRNINDIDLATDAGYSHNTVANWRRGVRAPTFQAIANLAAVLGYEVILRKTP